MSAHPEDSTPRADVDPSLLDVVPWSHGYAHSWALAALLRDERIQAAVLRELDALPGPAPHRIVGAISRETGVKPRRADLAFTLVDDSGARHQVAVETKVNDPFDADQVLAYRAAGFVPLLNLPSSTGVLLAVTEPTVAGEVRLMPAALLAAVDACNVTFSVLLAGYLTDLRDEWARAERALAQARGDSSRPVGDGRTPARLLEDVAWIAEVYRALPAAAEGSRIGSRADVRIVANDRGVFFADSFAWTAGDGGLWVDVVADIRTGGRSVAVKSGEAGIADAWDAAAAAGPPSGGGWRRTARKVGGDTCTVWKMDLDRGVAARDAAAVAVQAARFTTSLSIA